MCDMPSRSTLIRGEDWRPWRRGLYFLGAVLVILGHPSAYLFTRLHLPSVWGVPIGLLMVGGLVGLHARQAGDPGYGLLGTVGFVLASVGDLLLATLGPFVSSAVPDGAFPFMMVMFVYVVVAWWGMICWGWPPCARLSCRCLGGLCRWPSSSWTYPLRRWRVR